MIFCAVRALEGHDREPDHVGRVLAQQALDGLADRVLSEDEVGHGDPVVGIDVAGEGRQRAVGHADGDARHVLERVGHREKQDVHLSRLLPRSYARFEVASRRLGRAREPGTIGP